MEAYLSDGGDAFEMAALAEALGALRPGTAGYWSGTPAMMLEALPMAGMLEAFRGENALAAALASLEKRRPALVRACENGWWAVMPAEPADSDGEGDDESTATGAPAAPASAPAQPVSAAQPVIVPGGIPGFADPFAPAQ